MLTVTTDGTGVITSASVKVSGSGYAVGDTLTILSADIGNVDAVITLRSVGAGGEFNDVGNGKQGEDGLGAYAASGGAVVEVACANGKYSPSGDAACSMQRRF